MPGTEPDPPTQKEILGVLRENNGQPLRKLHIARKIAVNRYGKATSGVVESIRTLLRGMKLRELPHVTRFRVRKEEQE